MSLLKRATKQSSSILFRAQARALSTQNAASTDSRFYPIYVHHLSKVCLEHLQDSRSEWLEQEGLSRGLQLNNDGTFTLHFPRTDDQVDNGRIW